MTDLMDSRIRARYVAKGKVSHEEVDKHLAALPDNAENAEWVDYEQQFEADASEEAAAEAAANAPEGSPAPEGDAQPVTSSPSTPAPLDGSAPV